MEFAAFGFLSTYRSIRTCCELDRKALVFIEMNIVGDSGKTLFVQQIIFQDQ